MRILTIGMGNLNRRRAIQCGTRRHLRRNAPVCRRFPRKSSLSKAACTGQNGPEKPKLKQFLESRGENSYHGIFPMVRLRISFAQGRSFKVLVIFPLIVTGLAILCAAAPLMCLSLLTVFPAALKVGDHDHAESRLPGAQPLLRSDLRIDATAGLASVTDWLRQDIQSISFESRFSDAQPLLRSDLRNGTTAGLASVPNRLQQGIQFIRFDAPTLAPMAFTLFCLRYPGDCETQRFTGDRIELNRMRWSELENINSTVNSSIQPKRNEEGLAGEKWLLGPARGDCHDYAVTKRHQLIARGWPARDVLLSEVVTVSGEHHLVTVVLTNSGDLVLDNLTDRIMPWFRTTYRWVRIQTPKNPNYWASISEQNAGSDFRFEPAGI